MSYFLIIQLLNEKNYAIKEIEQKNLSIFTFCQSELDHPKWGVIKKTLRALEGPKNIQ